MDLNDVRRTLANRISPKDPDDDTSLGWTARGVVGTIADVCGVAAVLISIVGLFLGAGIVQGLLAAYLGAMAFTFLGLTFQLQRRFTNESRRAQANPMLVQCHQHLRDGSVALNGGDASAYSIHVALAARSLAAAYQQATGAPCRIAIQSIDAVSARPAEALVETICRSFDPDHGSREANLDRYAEVGLNTDYLSILEGSRVFFSNDLPRVPKYQNSHFDVRLPDAQWPYRSVIVTPITGPDPDPEGTGSSLVIGFLCVDSDRPKVFVRHLDVPTAKSVAAAIYSSLSLYRARRVDENQSQESTDE